MNDLPKYVTGCTYFHECETCPFPPTLCGVTRRQLHALARQETAVSLSQQGLSARQIALRLGCTVRQIKRYRAGGGDMNF